MLCLKYTHELCVRQTKERDAETGPYFFVAATAATAGTAATAACSARVAREITRRRSLALRMRLWRERSPLFADMCGSPLE